MFLSTFGASLWRSTFIILRLSVLPFSRSFDEAGAPPVCLLPRLARSALSSLLFIFTRFISTPCMFGLSAVSDMDLKLRAPLRSWGPSECFDVYEILGGTARSWGSRQFFLMFLAFSERVLKLSANFQSLPRELVDIFHPISLGVSPPVNSSDVYPLISRQSLWALHRLQKVPCFIGDLKFLEVMIRTC